MGKPILGIARQLTLVLGNILIAPGGDTVNESSTKGPLELWLVNTIANTVTKVWTFTDLFDWNGSSIRRIYRGPSGRIYVIADDHDTAGYTNGCTTIYLWDYTSNTATRKLDYNYVDANSYVSVSDVVEFGGELYLAHNYSTGSAYAHLVRYDPVGNTTTLVHGATFDGVGVGFLASLGGILTYALGGVIYQSTTGNSGSWTTVTLAGAQVIVDSAGTLDYFGTYSKFRSGDYGPSGDYYFTAFGSGVKDTGLVTNGNRFACTVNGTGVVKIDNTGTITWVYQPYYARNWNYTGGVQDPTTIPQYADSLQYFDVEGIRWIGNTCYLYNNGKSTFDASIPGYYNGWLAGPGNAVYGTSVTDNHTTNWAPDYLKTYFTYSLFGTVMILSSTDLQTWAPVTVTRADFGDSSANNKIFDNAKGEVIIGSDWYLHDNHDLLILYSSGSWSTDYDWSADHAFGWGALEVIP
jgi:hypothetical protein